jgi:hypothetical protein
MKNSFLSYNNNLKLNEFFVCLLVCIQAFLSGSFLVIFDIAAHIHFIEAYGAEMMPKAFVISGAIGFIYMLVYVFFSNRLNFRFFVLSNYLIILTILVNLFINEDLLQAQFFNIPLMMPFTLMLPVNIIVLLIFWRSARNIFSPEKNRILSNYIKASQISGMIISSFILLGLFYLQWDRNLMMVTVIILLSLVIVFQLIINIIHRFSPSFYHPPKKLNPLRSRLIEFFYTRYTFLLLVFVILSTIIGYIFHYQFIALASITFPSLSGFSKFLAFSLGFMFIISFVFEKYLIRKILYTYDSPYSLVLVPLAVGIAIIVAMLVNVLAGAYASINRFTYVFLIIVIVKIAYHTIYNAIEIPSLRVLFRTLDLRFQDVIIPRIEGSFRMAGMALAGILIMALLYFKLDKILFQNIIILFLSIIWLIIGYKLVKTYQSALITSIRKLKINIRQVEQELINTDEKAHRLINHTDPRKAITALSLFEQIEPMQYEKHLIGLLGSSSFEIKKYLLEKIDEYSVLNALSVIKTNPLFQNGQNKETQTLVSRIMKRFETKLSFGQNKETLNKLSNSHNIADRILAAEIAGTSGRMEWNDIVISLSRDIEPDVKNSAMRAMARLNCAEHRHMLIGYLSSPNYYQLAFEALIKIGDPALDQLDQVFLQPDADNAVLSRIIRIYGKIGSPRAIELLLSKIENQNRYLVKQAIISLREAKFQATQGNINRLLNAIIRLINLMAWNFNAYHIISKSEKYLLLKEALESEIKDNYSILFHLLSLAYNTASISNIRNMLEEGNDTDISYAIEMLDQIINEEIKQIFFPLIENLSIKSRIKQLEYFFQVQKTNAENLINEIIIRDFNSISHYTRACAIFSILKTNRPLITNELLSIIFHPDKLLYESTAFIIAKIDPDYLNSVYPRLSASIAIDIQHSIEQCKRQDMPFLLLDKIRFLKQVKYCSGINEDVLLEISRHLEINTLKTGDQLLIRRNDVHYPFIIIYDGKAEIRNSENKVFIFRKNDIIYSDIFSVFEAFTFKALTDLKFFSLDQEMLNLLAFDSIEFRKFLFELIEEA